MTPDEARATLVEIGAEEAQEWWGTDAYFDLPPRERPAKDATAHLDAFLAHPDELLVLLGMEQVGYHDKNGRAVSLGSGPIQGDTPVYRRVRPEETPT